MLPSERIKTEKLSAVGMAAGYLLVAIGYLLPWSDFSIQTLSGNDLLLGAFSGGAFGIARIGLILVILLTMFGVFSSIWRVRHRGLIDMAIAPAGLLLVLIYAPVTTYEIGYLLCALGFALAFICKFNCVRFDFSKKPEEGVD